jgi:phosphoribosylamine--glycine ligase
VSRQKADYSRRHKLGDEETEFMKVLVVGSGGREHAILASLKRTSRTPLQLYCAPGNAGIMGVAECISVSVNDHQALIEFARTHAVDLTIVGPEVPLAEGLVDEFDRAGLKIVGPTKAAARLEGSKSFAKDFMQRHQIPTARYAIANSAAEALNLLATFSDPAEAVVIKADGLAAGKGVVVAQSRAEAEQAVKDLCDGSVVSAEAADRILIEEALQGTEVSVLLFTDGNNYSVMPAARDHKRIGDKDSGPNTGGMGAITGPSVLDEETLARIVREVVEPTIKGAAAEGFPFRGILFIGLMLTAGGPKVLEYNVRFGDPETQAILIRLQSDLFEIFEAIVAGTLGDVAVHWNDQSSACVVLASGGYPGKYEINLPIRGLDQIPLADDFQVFHAGTAVSASGELVTAGGRVLGVTAAAGTLEDALEKCYRAIDNISWNGMQYRRDIGRFRESAARK